MPTYLWFGAALVIIGLSVHTFTTSANSFVQLSTEPFMRGRVLAILLAVSLGGTPLGSPVAGWVADTFGPRWSLGVGAAAGIAALIVGLLTFRRRRNSGSGTPS
jgi:MFS family permease